MAALKKKDDDMRAMEERYKMYLEKARNVSDKNIISLFLFIFYSSGCIQSFDPNRVQNCPFIPACR